MDDNMSDDDSRDTNTEGSSTSEESSSDLNVITDSDFSISSNDNFERRGIISLLRDPILQRDSFLSAIDDDLMDDSSSTSSNFSPFETSSLADSTNLNPDHPVFKKQQPKHNWFIIPEIINRQMGYNSKKQGVKTFEKNFYGSLHCVQRLELMYKLKKHSGCVNSLNFHPSGSLLASGSDDLNVVIWDWKSGAPLLNFHSKHKSNVFQSKFLPLNGDLHIATCARDGQVRLAQVSALEGLRSSRKLGSHRQACHKLAVLNNQPHIILSAGEDGMVLSHDVRNSKPNRVVTVRSNNEEVSLYSINAHPLNDYEFCVSGCDYMVRTYDQRKCGVGCVPLNVYYPNSMRTTDDTFPPHNVTCAIYNYNGTEILASYSDDDIYIFDVNNTTPGTFVHQYQGHHNGATIKGVNYFGPKSEFIISGSDCGNIYIWEKNSEAIVNWILADDTGVVNCLEPHPHLPILCTSGLDWDIKMWAPSSENGPSLQGLVKTVMKNAKARNRLSDGLNENQMLWILLRRLRSTQNIRSPGMNSDHSNVRSPSTSGFSNSEEETDVVNINPLPNCETL